MSRARTNDNRNKPSFVNELFDLLRDSPFWVGPLLAFLLFAILRWVLPALSPTLQNSSSLAQSTFGTLAILAHKFAPLAGALILLIWLGAEFKKWSDRSRLDKQTGAASIRALSWQEFESLLAEAFRRQGFAVDHTGSTGPDGGIDLRLIKAGARTLMQCKHWKSHEVGVRIVRELRGIMASENAQSGIVVTSGRFTRAAKNFAESNPIRLIDGCELVPMIGAVQTSGRIAADQTVPPTSPSLRGVVGASAPRTPTPTACPICNSPMIPRTAKRGPNAGSHFLGCSRYPDCRGTRNLEAK